MEGEALGEKIAELAGNGHHVDPGIKGVKNGDENQAQGRQAKKHKESKEAKDEFQENEFEESEESEGAGTVAGDSSTVINGSGSGGEFHPGAGSDGEFKEDQRSGGPAAVFGDGSPGQPEGAFGNGGEGWLVVVGGHGRFSGEGGRPRAKSTSAGEMRSRF